jgi:hypothetical protein
LGNWASRTEDNLSGARTRLNRAREARERRRLATAGRRAGRRKSAETPGYVVFSRDVMVPPSQAALPHPRSSPTGSWPRIAGPPPSPRLDGMGPNIEHTLSHSLREKSTPIWPGRTARVERRARNTTCARRARRRDHRGSFRGRARSRRP